MLQVPDWQENFNDKIMIFGILWKYQREKNRYNELSKTEIKTGSIKESISWVSNAYR